MSKELKNNAAIEQPVPAALPPDLDKLVADLRSREPALLMILAERAQQVTEEKEGRDRLERMRQEIELSATERTQRIVDRLYGADGPRRITVSIPKDPSQPTLSIPARTPEEARGKYFAVCGIRATEHDVMAA